MSTLKILSLSTLFLVLAVVAVVVIYLFPHTSYSDAVAARPEGRFTTIEGPLKLLDYKQDSKMYRIVVDKQTGIKYILVTWVGGGTSLSRYWEE